jgi:hypothetical protein
MAKKKPPIIPILDEIALSPSLASAKVTSKSLSKGVYQKKLAAHFAPHLLPKTLNALRESVQCGNIAAIKTVLELYEMVQSDKKISIINDNRSVNVDARGDGSGRGPEDRSFEHVARLLDETREKRLATGNPLAGPILDITDFTPTPERDGHKA